VPTRRLDARFLTLGLVQSVGWIAAKTGDDGGIRERTGLWSAPEGFSLQLCGRSSTTGHAPGIYAKTHALVVFTLRIEVRNVGRPCTWRSNASVIADGSLTTHDRSASRHQHQWSTMKVAKHENKSQTLCVIYNDTSAEYKYFLTCARMCCQWPLRRPLRKHA